MKITELINILNNQYNFNNQEEWDRCGVLKENNIDTNQNISKIIISLDISKTLIQQAIKNKANVIITHHPIYVGEFIEQYNQEWINEIIEMLNKNNIIHIALHTCFDTYQYGTSYSIIKSLFNNKYTIKRLNNSKYCDYITLNKTIKISKLIKLLNKTKKLTYLKTLNTFLNKSVKTIGVVGGSGYSEIYDILNSDIKIDCLLTGDIKWHNFNEAYELDFPVIDICHDAEWLGCLEIYNFLKTINEDLNILLIEPIRLKIK